VAENDDSASSSEITSMDEKAGRNRAAKEDERPEQVIESIDTSAGIQQEQGYLKGDKINNSCGVPDAGGFLRCFG